MKQSRLPSFLLLNFCLTILFSGCISDHCERTMTYTTLEPVYMSYEEMRAAVKTSAPRDLKVPGKIYFYHQYILISEVNEGIHIIDNQNPSNPQAISFIEVPGNHDLAVKGNILYADSYIDLVAIDITSPTNAFEVDRQEEVFPYYADYNGFWADETQGVIQDWKLVEKTETLNCADENVNIPFAWGCVGCSGGPIPFGARDELALSSFMNTNSNNFATTNGIPQTGAELPSGIGGSLARFTLYQDFLYAVTDQDLIVFDISAVDNPKPSSRIDIGWQIETIFPLRDKLFIGSQFGMFIYDLSNPQAPSYVSEFQHVRSCDPVVVEGDYAYVTLREGTNCPGGTNQLDVVDIATITNPRLVTSYPMFNPHGLGIRNSTLFLCDGEAGLKVFDASDVNRITQNQLAHFDNIHALDVIPLNNLLLLIGEDGFYQYDYSNVKDIQQLSHIPIIKN